MPRGRFEQSQSDRAALRRDLDEHGIDPEYAPEEEGPSLFDEATAQLGDKVMYKGVAYTVVSRIPDEQGLTVRQYYSHFTDGIGPGPGYDHLRGELRQRGLRNESELPDILHIRFVLEDEEGNKEYIN